MDNIPGGKTESKSSNFFSKRPVWWWVVGIFGLLLLIFLIVILVLVIVDFTRESNLQSQMQPGALLHTIKKGFGIGNDLSNNKLSFCFSKTYKLNPGIMFYNNSDTLHNYLKKKYNEITDPSDYIYNNQDKFYINIGKIDIYDIEEDEDGKKNTVVYSIASNLPYFSAIKLIHIGLDNNDQTFSIRHRYNLCTSEVKDEDRKCHKSVGKHIHQYNHTFNENIQKTDLYSTVYLLMFFINENDLSKPSQTTPVKQHKNLLGDIAFILNLDKC
jgi:hypothetical protein